jgi:hypothetical protein
MDFGDSFLLTILFSCAILSVVLAKEHGTDRVK